MKVLKFGGTSMGSVEALKTVKDIIISTDSNVVVVVSAMSGVTNSLVEISRLAHEKQADKIDELIDQLYSRHIEVAKSLLTDDIADEYSESLKFLLVENLKNATGWIINSPDATPLMISRMEDHIVCVGELASSGLLRLMLSDSSIAFAPDFIKTTRYENRDELDKDTTLRLIKSTFADIKSNIIVTQGFIASDRAGGFDTNLGRGGSDFTAALIAAALDADCLEIWTDVDGVMTADPRKDPTATVIPEMTYAEAQRIADEGAKVIYPPTIAPVAEKNIPLWIKNTFNPMAKGTLIK